MTLRITTTYKLAATILALCIGAATGARASIAHGPSARAAAAAGSARQATQTDFNWSGIPLLYIDTDDGTDPTCTYAYPPDGCIGLATNSEYLKARVTIVLRGDTLYESGPYRKAASGLRIKIRGNSSGTLTPPPYKLRLERAGVLLTAAPQGAKPHKDWALLPFSEWNSDFDYEPCLLHTTGCIVNRALARLLGTDDWTPRSEFVNVVLNGTWRGMYCLSETVEPGEGRMEVAREGFIIENDAYWWNAGGDYFKSSHQHSQMGWTWKYPDADDLTLARKAAVAAQVEGFERALFEPQPGESPAEWMDYTSAARWLIGQDILGNQDSAGSNLFLWADSAAGKPGADGGGLLRMGPMWDFSGIFMWPDSLWSNVHTDANSFCFPALTARADFREAYLRTWHTVRDGLLAEVQAQMDSMTATCGAAVDSAGRFMSVIRPRAYRRKLADQQADMMARLRVRWHSVDSLCASWPDPTVGIAPSPVADPDSQSAPRQVFDLSGRPLGDVPLSSLPPGIYVVRRGTHSQKVAVR